MNRCINDILWGYCTGEFAIENTKTDDSNKVHTCQKDPKICGKYVEHSTLCNELVARKQPKVS